MTLELPPRFVNIPAEALFSDMSDSIKVTLAQLHGLAWQTKGERTPPATVKELADVRGLSERQMYEHLAALKGQWIRIEKLENYRVVIYPLRWEPAAALATDNNTEITEAEFNALFEPQTSAVFRRGCTKNGQTSAEKAPMFLKHVVVNSKSESESEQQHGHDQNMVQTSAEFRRGLEKQLTDAFIAEGEEDAVAAASAAATALRKFGAEKCLAGLLYFHDRCELQRATESGLRNPVGLFFESVKGNWRPPSPPQKSQAPLWYAGAEDIIQT